MSAIALRLAEAIAPSATSSHFLCGNTFQQDDAPIDTGGYALRGDLCLTSSWIAANADPANGKALLVGITDGKQFLYDVHRWSDDSAVLGKKIGEISYTLFSAPINGLIGWATLVLGPKKTKHTLAVFRKTKATLAQVDGAIDSVELVYHQLKFMTPEEIVRYTPKATKSLGKAM
jgi:hypothetical protein